MKPLSLFASKRAQTISASPSMAPVAIAIAYAIVGFFIFITEKPLRIAYAWAIQKPWGGFDILVNGVPRTFRDTEAAAYEAALNLKKRWPAEIVTIKNSLTGVAVMMGEDGRTA